MVFHLDYHLQIILGVDRLDYTKGLPNRLLAYELFLEQHPEFIGHCILLQVRNLLIFLIERKQMQWLTMLTAGNGKDECPQDTFL